MCIVQCALRMLFIILDKMWWSGYDMNKTDPDIEIFWCKKLELVAGKKIVSYLKSSNRESKEFMSFLFLFLSGFN